MLVSEVNLSAIKDNIRFIRSRVNTRFCAVVKCDAYGHGLVPTAAAIEGGVDVFGVATEDEARALSAAGITKDIYILGRDYEIASPLPKNIVPTVCNAGDVAFLSGRVKRANIAVNTGMNRLGVRPEEVFDLFFALSKAGIRTESIYTHFGSTDTEIRARQFDEFLSVLLPLRKHVRIFHACASNCLALPPVYHLDMVRAGLAMYGYGSEGLRPAMTVYTSVVAVRELKAGEHVSYGDFTLRQDTRIAVIRAGYGDGLSRTAANAVSLHGKVCKVIGKVCMDMCMIDIKNIECAVGDRVFLLGEALNMEKFCKNYNTISHEVLTKFHGRAEKKYVR